jgi:2-haloacid dehalogenase
MAEAGKACVFDAYGTLFDVHSAVARHAARLGEQAQSVSAVWRLKQLEYSWVRSLMRRHADFWQLTGEALDTALASHGIADSALRQALMDAYLVLDAYPEVKGALRRLRADGVRTAILSNGTPAMLESAVRSAGLDDVIEACFSIETAGIYKPDPRVYTLAVEGLGVPAERIWFQSSNPWDIAGATAFGFRTVWVNRGRQPREYGWIPPAAEVDSLTALPDLVSRG